ncbi:MAG: sporulation peptidase YabG [Firmicutes bacterium]|nr:sporulation peptidase YabG [Bacillota bacterium]
MNLKIGDLVTRNSYNNDTVFKVIKIDSNNVYLKGVTIRLYADSDVSDLAPYDKKETEIIESDNRKFEQIKDSLNLDRNEYFYLPGRILHIDGDKEYLDRCLKFYKDYNILAYGVHSKENEVSKNIRRYLEETNADIVVITGHDAYYKKKGAQTDLNAYKNSDNFVKSIKEARKYEKAHDKLIIIAGACQSDYEELIKAGANFASSPKRINIHALDPAIIATMIGLTDKGDDIDLIGILSKTKYGSDGIGGIKTKGTMYVGYPR